MKHAPSQQSAAASYGTIIHYVTEQIDRGLSFEDAQKMFEMLWKEPERLGAKPDYYPPRTSYDSYKRKGRLTIIGYEEMRSWGKPQSIAYEYPFKIPFGEHELRGRIDRLDIRETGKGKCLAVVDKKTAYKRPSKYDLRVDLQFSIYLLALQQKQFWTGIPGDPDYLGFADGEELYEEFKDWRHAGIYMMLGESCTELDVGERLEEDFRQLYTLVDSVARSYEAELFIPRISSATCGMCDYWDLCGIDIPKPPLEVKIDDPTRVV